MEEQGDLELLSEPRHGRCRRRTVPHAGTRAGGRGIRSRERPRARLTLMRHAALRPRGRRVVSAQHRGHEGLKLEQEGKNSRDVHGWTVVSRRKESKLDQLLCRVHLNRLPPQQLGVRRHDYGAERYETQGVQMTSQMRAHMELYGANAAPAGATSPGMMSQILDQMGADMRGMSMPSTPEWSAVTDSVTGPRGTAEPERASAH
jgi:hypothetical protein